MGINFTEKKSAAVPELLNFYGRYIPHLPNLVPISESARNIISKCVFF